MRMIILLCKLLRNALITFSFVFLLYGEPCSLYAAPSAEDLTTLSLEDLMALPITSVSKRPQKLSEAAAAVFVITQEDIRRSGATSIPELLRMVPGIEVARIDANKWAVTSRGFNGRFSNKLLVLFDGRTVYSPLFSGVFWESLTYILEDIERIEVIRGPGASLWGANAVNGVINIITKKTKDTQGGLESAAFGTHEAYSGTRYGGKFGDKTFYRVYTKYHYYSGFPGARSNRSDRWNYSVSGFRFDHDLSSRDFITFQGDILNLNTDEMYLIPSFQPPFTERRDTGTHSVGGDAILRWNRTLSPTSNFQLQAYYDRGDFTDDLLSENLDIFDLEIQHQFRLGESQTLIWGLGHRFEQDRTRDSPSVRMSPSNENNLFSAFFQDEIKITDKLNLTLGSRFEHNDHTGFEIQPNARLLWTPAKNQSMWTAVSRAVRTPSWAEERVSLDASILPTRPPAMLRVYGTPDFESEELNAFELGYRIMPNERLSFDIAGFYNIYNNLRSLEMGEPFMEVSPSSPFPHVVVPFTGLNKLAGDTFGVELSADWQALKWWRIQAAYTFLKMDLRPEKESNDIISAGIISGSDPHHQFSLRSWMDLPHDTSFDLWLRFVDDLPALDVASYLTLDARLAWRPVKNLELSVIGQNLLNQKHVEATPDFLGTIEARIERSVYGKLVWRF